MKKRVLKRVLLLACVALVGAASVRTTCVAASGGITASCSSSMMSGIYTYGAPGHQLRITLYGYERKGKGEDIVKTSSLLNGDYTSVSHVGYPDKGYKFYKMSAFGLVDGKLDAAKQDVPAS